MFSRDGGKPMATTYFNRVYLGTGASYTTSSNSIAITSQISGNGFRFVSANPSDPTYIANGNDVAGTLYWVNGSGAVQSVVGVISRHDVASGNNNTAFYFVTTGGSAYLLVEPGDESRYSGNQSVGTNSSGFVTDLNSLLTTQASQPIVSVADTSAGEGAGYAVFTVSLTNPASGTVTFTPTLASGSAAVGTDTGATLQSSTDGGVTWTNVSGSVSIPNGSSSIKLRVAITDDASIESNETFQLLTGTITGGGVINNAGAYGTATITDNDSAITVGTPDITSGTDTGANDLTTAHGLPVITFSGSAGLTITLTGPGGTSLTENTHFSVAYSGGTYTVTLLDAQATAGTQPFGTYAAGVATGNPTATADGTYTLAANNGGSPVTVGSFVIDTTGPATATVASLSTTSTTPTLTGTATVGSGETLTVAVGGTTYTEGDGHLSRTGSNWSLTPNTLAVGTYSVTATVTDTAGNATSDTTSSELTITLPSFSVGTPDITSGTDTGANDLTTAHGLPVISFTGSAGLTITLTGPGGTSLTENTHFSVAYSSGTYTVTLLDAQATAGTQPFGTYASGVATGNPTATADGTYTLEANNGGSPVTVGSFVIDTTGPATATVASISTTSTTPTLTGMATVGSGETLTVAVGGTTYTEGDGHLSRTGSNWSLTPNTLAVGTYSVTATVTDTAGNATSDTTSSELTITLPSFSVGTPDITSGTDTGANDLTTAHGLPVISFTGSAGLTITLTGPGGTSLTENTHFSVAYSGGTYTVTLLDAQATAGTQPFGTYAAGVATGNPTATADGTYTLEANNGGTPSTVGSFVIDTTAPAAPTVATLSTTDTTPTITGTATVGAGEALTVTVGGTTYTDGDGHLSRTGSAWSLVPNALAVGSYSVTATITDTAGNATSDTTSSELTIALPSFSVGTPDITSGTDTGANDLTTGHGLPVITFTGSAGLTITLTGPGGTSLTENTHFSVAYSSGTYTVTLLDAQATAGTQPFGTYASGVATGNPTATADGTYTLEANNGGSPVTVGTFAIDTTAPATPTVASLSTTSTTPTLIGTATVGTGEALTVAVGGTTYTDGDGHLSRAGSAWSLTPNTLAVGTYSVTATVTDTAGNTTSDATSSELAVTAPVVLSPPPPPPPSPPTPPVVSPPPPPEPPPPAATGTLAPGADDGASTTDRVTSQIQPGLHLEAPGLLSGGDTLRLTDASGVVLTTQALTLDQVAQGGATILPPAMDDGTYTLTLQVVGADGREKAAVPVTVTVVTDSDGVAPSVELTARGGDFNGDGVADWKQNNVVQAPLTSAADFKAGAAAGADHFGALMAGDIDVHAAAGVRLDAGAQLLNVRVVETPATTPIGAKLASGVFDFTLTGQADAQLTDLDPTRAGLQTRVVIDLPAGVMADTYLKWNAAAGAWRSFLDDGKLSTYDDGATLLDTNGDGRVDRIVLTFTDGGAGDDDGLANGVIVDPGALALTNTALPVFSIRLANGDRIYTTDAAEASRASAGTSAVFEGVRFDSLQAGPGVQAFAAYHHGVTGDWDYARSAETLPYACYESAAGAGFSAHATAQAGDTVIRLYMRADGVTQLLSQADATALGLTGQGFMDRGAAFSTTNTHAFQFDVEGYLVANAGDAEIRDLVARLAQTYRSTADAGFVDAVEQNYLQHGVGCGLYHGDASDAAHVNSLFGVNFAG